MTDQTLSHRFNQLLLRYKSRQNKDYIYKTSSYGCGWQSPPEDIMEKILKHVSLGNQIRSTIVCKSWMSVVIRTAPRVQFPWLVLPPTNPNCLSFSSLSEGKVFNLKLPKAARGSRLVGSSKGWLIMVKGKELNSEIFLLDPILGAQHQLPALKTIPSFRDHLGMSGGQSACGAAFFLNHIALSSSDISECMVAAAFGSQLGLCKPREKRRRVFDILDEDDYFVDTLFTSTGMLYALVRSRNSNDGVITLTLNSGEEDGALVLNLVYNNEEHNQIGNFVFEYYNDYKICKKGFYRSYLLESTENEILLINRIHDSLSSDVLVEKENPEMVDLCNHVVFDVLLFVIMVPVFCTIMNPCFRNLLLDIVSFFLVAGFAVLLNKEKAKQLRVIAASFKYLRTSGFEVYKIIASENNNNLLQVQNLGDQIIFVADGGSSFILRASDFKEMQGNSIYFASNGIHDVQGLDNLISHISRDIGVFYLDGEKIVRYFPSVNMSIQSQLNWFTPKLF
ncbi:hypothetical protein M0R45_007370 [Rubus argutus]|uniref:F-box domain-containing protein n=1 Tax=Rubus argutus TaxID=59490 RepID=A0AAW1Y1F6_RUBAR